MNNNEKYWYAFAKLTKTASAFVNRVYEHFGSIELAWHAEAYDLWRIEGLQERQIKGFLSERPNINPDECYEYIKERNIDFIHLEDERYPYLLRHIDNPPTGLFMLGDLSVCNLERTLAVVGSRRASENSKKNLRNILSGFANTDICIVSGLAEGIDTVAHKAAVDNNIKTIAVIGGGFDRLYPKSNIKLFNDIINGRGAVLTEYWPDVDAISWHFPVRNRIVSGLSKGVLVAEAALKSGAMITGKLALEQNRELMCMPGLISNPNTEGIYSLLKNGATMVTKTDDILDALGWQVQTKNTEKKNNFSNFSEEEQLILDFISKDALTMDELILKTNLNIDNLMVILTKLELDGVISQTTGEKYIMAV
ncbi:MAG: DNA-processing protein DprA [Candidatus Gastranaerophilales bacterium]|nr:DNA-processing protein DprA [Candidatus Gastranaerophilales bacterium]